MNRFLALLLLAFVPSLVFAQGRVFYDGFESGNTSLWSVDAERDTCKVVTTSVDGIAGAYAGSNFLSCNENGTLLSSDYDRYQVLELPLTNRTNELFIRTKLRVDTDQDRTTGSPKKLLRWFQWSGDNADYCDYFSVVYVSSLINSAWFAGTFYGTYWGELDSAANSASWHEIEMYFNWTTGNVRTWLDGVLVRDNTVNLSVCTMTPLHITSNTGDPTDATNHVYFDEFEVFSDTGSGGVGSMQNGTITQGAGAAPTVSAVTCSPSVIQSGNGSTTCSATYGNSPTSYAWTGARGCCSFGTPSASSTTYTCTCGGSDTVCVNATNGSGSSGATCTGSGITYRYARPSNVSVH